MADINFKVLWGPLKKLVDMLDGTHAERILAQPPAILLTGTTNPRLRVDSGQTGFFEGREFRTFHEFSVPSGQSIYIKFVSPIDFILFEQTLTIDAGSIRFNARTGSSETAPFNASLPIFGKNRMAERVAPFYTNVITMFVGGTVTGGTIVESFRVVAANATAQQQSVGGAAQSERGLPAGTYYLQLENFGNSTATGVYSLFWEERP